MPRTEGRTPSRKTYPLDLDRLRIDSWPYTIYLSRQNRRHVCRIEGCGVGFNEWDDPSGAVAMFIGDDGHATGEWFDVCAEHASVIYDTPL